MDAAVQQRGESTLLPALVLADTWGIDAATQRRLLARLLGRGPARAPHLGPPARRRSRLVSLGLLRRGARAHALTARGREVLGAHADLVAELRRHIEDLLEEEREADLAFAEAMEPLPPEDPAPSPGPWRRDEHVDLSAAALGPHVAHLHLPEALLAQVAAALSSGKHLLLAGPPGTGKTELALGVGAAAAAAGYCRGIYTATASAEWTTFETVGGYALERDGALAFRAGVFPAALERGQWLLVDELNRADVDRAFGELYTVLAGRGASTPFRGADGRAVSLGPEEGATFRVPPSFRLVATINTWDRQSLFRLSAALLRRFAVVHVGPPDAAAYALLIAREAEAGGRDPPLDPGARASLERLFCRAGLLDRCPIGPAIALDMVRYARRRAAGGEGLAEAVALILLPQLEGLPADAAPAVASLLDAELARAAPARALEAVRARLRELCPDLPRRMTLAPWEAFLAEHFPGYLLPDAYRRALPAEVAARFLARLGAGPRHLFLLRAASVVAARGPEIRELALTQLPDLSRRLPRRVEAERLARAGELRGALDVPATLRRRATGRLHEIVARARRPPRRPPEDALVAAVATRLLSVLRELHAAGVLGRAGWGEGLAPCAEALDRALRTAELACAAGTPIAAFHEQAARAAPHPAYALALALHRALRRGLDGDDPEMVGRALAEGALVPLADHTRFELAVLLRLLQALEGRPRWALRRTLVVSRRREVAELQGRGGARVRVYYDQACLEPGPYDAGLRRYLGQRGRLRPDITVVASAPGRAPRATVIEAKLSADPGYLAAGYREAIVYAAEYGAALTGWPKAILVTSAPVAAPPCRDDEAIAVGWDGWVPEIVIEGLLEGMER